MNESSNASISGSDSEFSSLDFKPTPHHTEEPKHVSGFISKSVFSVINKKIGRFVSYSYSKMSLPEVYTKLLFAVNQLQILLPSLLLLTDQYVNSTSIIHHTKVALSFFQRVIPITAPIKYLIIEGYILLFHSISESIWVLSASARVAKVGNVSEFFIKITNYNLSLSLFIFPTFYSCVLTELICRNSFGSHGFIIGVLTSILFILSFLWKIYFFVECMFFVPLPNLYVVQKTMIPQIIITILINIFSVLGVLFPSHNCIYFSLLVISYVFLLIYSLLFVVNLNENEHILMLTTLSTAIPTTVISWLNIFGYFQLPNYTYLLIIILYILLYISLSFYVRWTTNKDLYFIENLPNDPSQIQRVRFTKVCELAVVGFKYNLDYMVAFQFFRDCIYVYHNSNEYMLLSVKFLLMYPESNSEVQSVIKEMKQFKKSSITTRLAYCQTKMIMTRRSTSMIPLLRTQLKAAALVADRTKLRIRSAFEEILNGTDTVSGLSKIVNLADTLVESDQKFLSIRNTFEFNVHAQYAYAEYLRNVSGNYIEYLNVKAYITNLRATQLQKDQAYLNAKVFFPSLSVTSIATDKSSRLSQTENDSMMSGFVSTAMFADKDEGQQARVAELVENTRILSVPVAYSYVIIVGLFTCALPVIIYPIIRWVIRTNILDVSHICGKMLQFRIAVSNIQAYNEVYRQIILGIFPETTFTTDPCILVLDTYFNATEILQDASDILTLSYDDARIQEAVDMIYMNNIVTEENSTRESLITNTSSVNYAIKIIQIAYKVASKNDTLTPREVSIMFDSYQAHEVMNTGITNIQDCVIDRAKKMHKLMWLIFTGYTIWNIITVLIDAYVINAAIEKDRIQVYNCFKALPRTVISLIIDKMKKYESVDEEKINTSHLDGDEEKAISEILLMKQFSRPLYLGNEIARLLYIVIGSISTFLLLKYSQGVLTQFTNLIYHIKHVTKVHNNLISIVVSLLKINLIDFNQEFNHSSREDYVKTIRNNAECAIDMYNEMIFNYAHVPTLISSEAERLLFKVTCDDTGKLCNTLPEPFQLKLLEVIEGYYKYLLDPYNGLNSTGYPEIIANFICFQIPEFINKLANSYIEGTYNVLDIDYTLYFVFSIILFICMCPTSMIDAYLYYKIGTRIKVEMRMLNHAPPESIIHSIYIMNILSEFKSKNASYAMQGEFAEDCIMFYPQMCFIVGSKDLKVLKHNHMGEDLKDYVFDPAVRQHFNAIGGTVSLNINGMHYTAYCSGNDSESGFVILEDMTAMDSLESAINQENMRTAELIEKYLIGIKKETVYSPHAAMLMVSVDSKDDSFVDVASEVVNAVESSPDKCYDYIEVLGDKIAVIAGIVKEKPPQETLLPLVHFASSLSTIKGIKLGLIGNTEISGVVNGLVLELYGDCFDYIIDLCSHCTPGGIIIDQTTYEQIYSEHFDVKELGLFDIAHAGKVNAYIINSSSQGI